MPHNESTLIKQSSSIGRMTSAMFFSGPVLKDYSSELYFFGPKINSCKQQGLFVLSWLHSCEASQTGSDQKIFLLLEVIKKYAIIRFCYI
jgi:hypothetical protein